MKLKAFIADVVFLLLFVTIGRNAHKDGISLSGELSTLWPFAVGLLTGWLFIGFTHRTATTRSSGIIIVLWTVMLGMILRVFAGQGTAVTFIVVALVFLSLFLVGWRILLSLWKSGRGVA